MADDSKTAAAFATSWNNLPGGSVYSREQFEDWFTPLNEADVQGKSVLELGCGNGSLLVHMMRWEPSRLEGVDLGDSVLSARRNLAGFDTSRWSVEQADLTRFVADKPFDVVYSIGVLHHLDDPRSGFDAVVRNTRPGGRFHCWVYAHEGNLVVRMVVEPLRRIACKMPWWLTKYGIATPLVLPYFVYAKALAAGTGRRRLLSFLPLHDYSLWIARRDFAFFRHVAFDQLVTPTTCYVRRSTIEAWLSRHPDVDPESTYIVLRNGNSWKFGGRRRATPDR